MEIPKRQKFLIVKRKIPCKVVLIEQQERWIVEKDHTEMFVLRNLGIEKFKFSIVGICYITIY